MKPATEAQLLAEIQAGGVVLADFWAPWCGPCQGVQKTLLEIEAEGHGFKIMGLNTDTEPAASARFGARGLPCLIVFAGGHEFERKTGAATKVQILSMLVRAAEGKK